MDEHNDQLWQFAITWVNAHKDAIISMGRRSSRELPTDIIQTAYLSAYIVISKMPVSTLDKADFLADFTSVFRRDLPLTYREQPTHPSILDSIPTPLETRKKTGQEKRPEQIFTLLEQLGRREAEVLMALTGYDSPQLTLTEIGRQKGLTRQTVAKLRDNGIRQLKNSSNLMVEN